MNDIITLLQVAHNEIENLRRVNSQMAPKVEAYSALIKVLGFVNREGHGYTEDILPHIAAKIKELMEPLEEPLND